jgi:pyridoxamine 5'-phosphate oxidase
MTADLDPHALAVAWLPTDDDPARPLMTLATVGADGAPDARSVLLSAVGDQTFAFHTDGRSTKAAEIARRPQVCLVLAWPLEFRQLVVHGRAALQDPAQSRAAYGRRSAYLRELAWTNDHDLAQLATEERRTRWGAAVAGRPDGPVEPPPTWVGFEVFASRYVFWESGPDQPSHRTAYQRTAGGWAVSHLPG